MENYQEFNNSNVEDNIYKTGSCEDILIIFFNEIYPKLNNISKTVVEFSEFSQNYGDYTFHFKHNVLTFDKIKHKRLKFFTDNKSSGELIHEGTYERNTIRTSYSERKISKMKSTFVMESEINGFVCHSNYGEVNHDTKTNFFGIKKYYTHDKEKGTFIKIQNFIRIK